VRKLAKACAGHKAMAELYFEDNNIGDGGAAAFASVIKRGKFRGVRTLSFINNNIGDAGALAFGRAFRKNPNALDDSGAYVQFDFASNNIGDDGANGLYRALREYEHRDRLYIDLADCKVGSGMKLQLHLADNQPPAEFLEWSKFDQECLFKAFGRAAKIKGWMLVATELLHHGMGVLVPRGNKPGDKARFEALRAELHLGRELFVVGDDKPPAPTWAYIACPIVFALKMRALCEARAKQAESTVEEDEMKKAADSLEQYAVALLEEAAIFKQAWDDAHPAVNMLAKVLHGQTIFEVAIDCGAYHFLANPVAVDCLNNVWLRRWRPFQGAASRAAYERASHARKGGARACASLFDFRLWDTPHARFVLAFVLRAVYAVYACYIATANTPFPLAVSWFEIGFLLWSLTLAMEEARQLLSAGVLSYLSDKWNVLDVLLLCLVGVASALRAAASLSTGLMLDGYELQDGGAVVAEATGEDVEWLEYLQRLHAELGPVGIRHWGGETYTELAGGIFGVAAALTLFRLLHVLTLLQSVGPLIVTTARVELVS
jgi:hypothetical protein